MVVVFHWNPLIFHYRHSICLVLAVLLVLIVLHFFEADFHKCPEDEPIDAVFTWVNGSDLEFSRSLQSYLHRHSGGWRDSSMQRYDDKDELLFSLRSLEVHAPWINHVYIVTNGQIPSWLNMDYDKVSIVTHKEIFRDKTDVPSFSSPAIEVHLHRIPGLSRRFIYFNDDMFLRSPIHKDDFVSPSRGFLVYLAWLVPACSPACFWLYVADGQCDLACNNPECQMDGGDCDGKTVKTDFSVNFGNLSFANDKQLNDAKANTTAPISSDRSNGSLPGSDHLTKQNNTLWGTFIEYLKSLNQSEHIQKLIAEHNQRTIVKDKQRRRKERRKNQAANGNAAKSKLALDAYGSSLQYTNRLLNLKYGFTVRKVPSHAPIMIDRTIMEALQSKFRKEFEATSRNRVRSLDDLQYSFMYYYYLIHETLNLTVDQIFDKYDGDASGFWSESEARTVVTKLYPLPLTNESLKQFENILIDCFGMLPHQKSSSIITKELVVGCPVLRDILLHKFGKRQMYHYTVMADAEKTVVAFKMLNSNVSDVLEQLDEIRKTEKKFVCLNDNLDETRPSANKLVKQVLLDFYVGLFPNRSQFELPPGLQNKYGHLDDYDVLFRNRRLGLAVFFVVCFLVVVVVILGVRVTAFMRATRECLRIRRRLS